MVTGASSNVGYMVQTPATPADGGLYGGHMKPGEGNGKGNMNTGEGMNVKGKCSAFWALCEFPP